MKSNDKQTKFVKFKLLNDEFASLVARKIY